MNESIKQFQHLLTESTPEDQEQIHALISRLSEQKNGAYSSLLNASLGIKKQITEDTCTATLTIRPFIFNSVGIPHGGIIATLADTAMGTLASSLAPAGHAAVTADFTIHYLSVPCDESVTAEAVVIRKGSRIMTIQCSVRGSDKKEVAFAVGTFMPVRRKD